MKCYFSVILMCAVAWMNLEDIILSGKNNLVLKRQLLCDSSCWVPADRGVAVESGVGLLHNNLPLHHSLTVHLKDMGICDSSRGQHYECTCCERASHRNANLGRDQEHSRVNYLQKMKTNRCNL